MTLEDWRLIEGLTYKALAAKLSNDNMQVTPETARRWCLPEGDALHRTPDPAWMRRIYGVTAGAVTPNDFAGL
jgi:hypothetical protein